MARMCQAFYCDQLREQLCCADCPAPCANRCLNHPSRCKLVNASKRVRAQTPPPKRARTPSKHLTQAEKDTLLRLLSVGELTQGEIARRIGCSPSTVSIYARRSRQEGTSHG